MTISLFNSYIRSIIIMTVAYFIMVVPSYAAVNTPDPNGFRANGGVEELVLIGDTLYVLNGGFTKVEKVSGGSYDRMHDAAIDLTNANILPWDLDIRTASGGYGQIYTLAQDDNYLYIGGDFTQVNGQARTHLASFNKTTGAITSWAPSLAANNSIDDMKIDAGTLYVVGDFIQINGNARTYVAAFDTSTGNLTSWAPSVSHSSTTPLIHEVYVDDAAIYIAGSFFDTIDGQTRRYGASFNKSTKALTSWDPNPNGFIYSIFTDSSDIYIAGNFTLIDVSSTRNAIASFNKSTGALNAWDPSFNGTVNDILEKDNTIYAVGNFNTVEGFSRVGAAGITKGTKTVTSWSPILNGGGSTIVADANGIYIGGQFNAINSNTNYSYLGFFRDNPFPANTPTPTPIPTQQNTNSVTSTSPVYRFWSDTKQGHFYTISEEEKQYVIDTYDDFVWRYEGIAYYAYAAPITGTNPVYRFWSDKNQGHFYTASAEEKDYVISNYDDFVWRYEGIAYHVYPLAKTDGTKTVYRFWSDKNQRHFYTASSEEKDYVINNYDNYIWRYEGNAWNVPQ